MTLLCLQSQAWSYPRSVLVLSWERTQVTEYYKGQRIEELLQQITVLEQRLHKNCLGEELGGEMFLALSEGYATLAIAKAKLTSLKGDKC
jgi:hypothetical protein